VGRSAVVCGRIVRVLLELEAAAYAAGADPVLRLAETGRLELSGSSAYRVYTDRLATAERALAPATQVAAAA
jgi:hypothetical protein